MDAYELGLKSGWFDGDLLLNLAAYHNEFSNFQLNAFNGIQFVVSTIPTVTVDGVELDASWRTPIEGLSLQGGAAYNDARYGDDALHGDGANHAERIAHAESVTHGDIASH